jgi:uncharacterized GH25 family protein
MSPWCVAARRALLLVLLAGSAGHTAAHEFWLQPKHYVVQPGQAVPVQMRVGDGWPGEPSPLPRERVQRFGWVDAQGERPVRARGIMRAGAAGPAWVVLRSDSARSELAADAFEVYLHEEGLDSVIEARQRLGESTRPGREAYSRCAKALVQVGRGAGAPHLVSQPLGLSLELVPQPATEGALAQGGFEVQLLFLGQPLPDALVQAFAQAGGAPLKARTDALGRLRLPLQPGVWLLSAVHMVRADANLDADWQSIWTSLTFQLKGPRAARALTLRKLGHAATARSL